MIVMILIVVVAAIVVVADSDVQCAIVRPLNRPQNMHQRGSVPSLSTDLKQTVEVKGKHWQTLFMSGWINEMTGTAIQDLYNWSVVSTPLKNISQLGLFFPIYGKITNVPNHQPDKYVQQETLVFFGNKWVAIQKQCCHQGDTVPWITSQHSKIDHLFTSLPLDANKLL